MDFGKILDKWESRQPSKEQKSEIIDKDAKKESLSTRGEKRRRLLNAKPDDILDIHGSTKENAWSLMEQFFTKARNNGYEKLRIIHGKGNHSEGEAVLKTTVRKFIEQCSYAGESNYENSANGGTGATWVFLKNID